MTCYGDDVDKMTASLVEKTDGLSVNGWLLICSYQTLEFVILIVIYWCSAARFSDASNVSGCAFVSVGATFKGRSAFCSTV